MTQQDGDTVDISLSEEPSESIVTRNIPGEGKETEVGNEERARVEPPPDEALPVDDTPVLDSGKEGDFKEVEEGKIEEEVKVQDGGHESDEEEKRAILAEEKILTLEEAEKV